MSETPPTTADELARALPQAATWNSRPSRSELRPLPDRPAVYMLLAADGTPVKLATTQSLRRALGARLADDARRPAPRADLGAITRGVRWHEVGSAFEARWRYYHLARRTWPDAYRGMLPFAPAWFLHADFTARVPEIRVTERVWNVRGECIGPWPSRTDCTRALEGLCDLFDLCRYPEQLRRLPHGRRCAYADMGRCDAPCDGTAPPEAYERRTREAWTFAAGAAPEWRAEGTERMRAAAASRHYELAALLKSQIEFADRWLTEWTPVIRPQSELRFLLAMPATRRRRWTLYLFDRGAIVHGPVVGRRELAAAAVDWLDGPGRVDADRVDPDERMEQTWLLAHLLWARSAAIIESLAPQPQREALRDRLARAVASRAPRAADGRRSAAGGETRRVRHERPDGSEGTAG